jgi:hypothetical protein
LLNTANSLGNLITSGAENNTSSKQILKDDENTNIEEVPVNQTEPNTRQLKFNNTFKKLSIDLNDAPTEFNIEEINIQKENIEVDVDEGEVNFQQDGEPIILSPVVCYFIISIGC